jgi:hypothetical protein
MIEEFYKSLKLSVGDPMERYDRVKFNRFIFEKCFRPQMEKCENSGRVVVLTEKDKKHLEDFAAKKVVAKTKEWKGFDNQMRSKREMTGASIEYGLLKFYGKEDKFDDSIVDKSYKKSHPDLVPLGVFADVKGSSINNVPLVFRKSRPYMCPSGKHKGKEFKCVNVIGITDLDKVWLLGIAPQDVLEKYSDVNLIMIAENTTKTGFYGALELLDIPAGWMEFKKLCLEKSKPI